MRSDQRPRLSPAIDGEAESRSPCRPLNGCGRKRDAQSIAFLRTPGIEALYSADAMTNASAALMRRQSSRAGSGRSPPLSASPSYDGQSKSSMRARSTSAPARSAVRAASSARRALSEQRRSEDEHFDGPAIAHGHHSPVGG